MAIDIGNTNMEFGVFDGERLIGSFRLGTNRDITSDEVGLLMMQFFSINSVAPRDIEEVIICSVVPQVMYSISNSIKKYLGKTALVVGADLEVGIPNKYANPAEVGADRLVNAKAAHQKYGGPLVVVDFGTATTFDAIDGEGAYLGGAIYPGIKISMDALFQKTAKLPKVELVDPGSVIGNTTVTSMQAGAVYGYVGAVERIVNGMKQELGGQTKVIATGGLSRFIAAQSSVFDVIDKPLTLSGLLMIYQAGKAEDTTK